jgi:hypothetical protein
MKVALLLAFCSLPAAAQDSKWVRNQFTDKLTGGAVTSYQLFAEPDANSARKPYIGITCDQADRRFTYGYFTDEMVYVDAQYSSVSSMYYPTTVKYRSDSAKPKSDNVTVRPDFRTINIDQGMLVALSGGKEFAVSFPSERGYMVTDVFASGPLPASYADDCYTEKMRRKQR